MGEDCWDVMLCSDISNAVVENTFGRRMTRINVDFTISAGADPGRVQMFQKALKAQASNPPVPCFDGCLKALFLFNNLGVLGSGSSTQIQRERPRECQS